MSSEDRTYKIGEVYYIEINGTNNEQRGCRPCVIFQNNVGNVYSPNIVALPLTTALKKTDMPTHIVLPSKETGLPKDSMVLCENPVCVSKTKIGNYITTLPNEYMMKIAEGNELLLIRYGELGLKGKNKSPRQRITFYDLL